MKRVLSLLLAGALLLAGSSCSSRQTLHFSLFSSSDLRPDSGDPELAASIEKWYRYAEDFMDMEIIIDQEILPNDRSAQRSNEYILRNDLADVFTVVDSSSSRTNLKELAKQGKILNLLDYAEYMPNYSRILEENWNYQQVQIDGGVYGFSTAVYNPAYISQYGWLYNYTAFQESGLSIPTDLEELYEVAKALKARYPDSYPIMFYSNDLLYICNTFGLLNRRQLLANYDGNAFRMGLFDDPAGWKETVKFLSRLYQEGLIDPNFDAYNTEQVEYSATNGKAFIIPNTWYGRAGELSNSGSYEWVCGNTPDGIGGQEPYFSAEPQGTTLSPNWSLCISADAEHPELLVKLIDNEYASAVMDRYNWGEEGVHYTVGENGQKQLIAKSAMEYEQLLEEHPRMPALRWNQDRGSQMAEKSLLEPVSTVFDGVYETMDYWTFSTRYIRADNALPNDSALARLARSSLTDEQSNTVSQDLRGVQNVILQNIRQFITGEKDLSEWDAFIEQAKQSGDYQSVLNVYNDQLDWLRTLSR